MAIEDLIAQGPTYHQTEGLAAAWQRMQAYQAQRAQQAQTLALGRQQMQENELKLRAGQQAYADDQQYRQIFRDNAGPATPATNATPPASAAPRYDQDGVQMQGAIPATPATGTTSPSGAQQDMIDMRMIDQLNAAGQPARAAAIRTAMAERRFKQAETAKNQAQADNDSGAAQEKHNALMFQATGHLIDMPDTASRVAAFPQILASLNRMGYQIDPNMPYPGDDWLQNEHGVAGTQVAKDAEAKAARDKEEFAAAIGGKRVAGQVAAATGAATLADPGLLNPEQRAADTRAATTAAEAARRDANTIANDAEMRRQGQQRLGLEGQANDIRRTAADPFGALGLNKHPVAGAAAGGAATTGTAFLGSLPPAMATRVQAIASGRETLTAREKGSPAGQALISAVEQYDKGWSEQRAQLRKAFTTGPDGRNIGNLNTAPVHLAALADAATAMQNGIFVPGNDLYNKVSTMFGGTAPTEFNGMKTVVAGEMAAAMKGNATDPEIAAFNHSVNDASSPAQLAGVIQKAFIPALAAKLNTYQERYHAQSPDDPWTPVLPSARAVFSRYGVDPTAAQGGAKSATNPFRK